METPRESQAPQHHSAPQLWSRLLHGRHGVIWLALGLALAVGFGTRLALTIKAAGEVTWGFSLPAAFIWGFLFDLGAALWWLMPLAIVLAAMPTTFFTRRWARRGAQAGVFIIVYLLCFGAVAEWFFWDEFGVRFNFIAVDYLVYTTEVVGNIRESYPMPVIYVGLFSVSTAVFLLIRRRGWIDRWLDAATAPRPARWRTAAGWTVACVVLGVALNQEALPNFANSYNRELAKGGLWSLFAAFRANQLDYDHFYPTVPEARAFQRTKSMLAPDGAQLVAPEENDLLRLVRHPGPERRLNVIQITVESLSAEFLSRYGNKEGITPNLDALVPRALVFDQLYATGNRTDRGMEALTLAVPPTPGRSLVKRPNNENLFTLGSVFRRQGYATAFIYGGFGYFDNMNHFFGENGYRVVDRTMVASEDITFANVWGACDEDLFRWTLREADRDHAAGKPFFYFVMTTSNHRPFTFPDGRIDLPSKKSGRNGGVKYTDYAIGKLLAEAEKKPWFKDTIFVIVADHCASSAGKTELPIQKYHIPMLIFSPGGQIKPGVVDRLMSQIDYPPTLLGLLNWSYPSRFYGWDILSSGPESNGRALLGNYQKLGLYRDGQVAVLKPMRQSQTLAYDRVTHDLKPTAPNVALMNDAAAYYQSASWLFKNGRQRALNSDDEAAIRAMPAHSEPSPQSNRATKP